MLLDFGEQKPNINEFCYDFLDCITDAAFILDYQAQIIHVNYSAAKLYGYDKSELIGNSIYLIKNKEFEVVFRTSTRPLLKKGTYVIEGFDYKKDGSIIYTSMHFSMFKVNNYEVIVGITHDLEECNNRVNCQESMLEDNNQFKQIVNSLTTITEVRDPYTANHQRRVANLSCAIAKEMNFDYNRTMGLYIAARLHDIGKIYVPNEILTKPGSINEYEFSLIKKHCEVGFDILNKIKFPWKVSEFVVQHHERINGTGYPFNLTGDSIYLESKILAVADVVESISSHRPYRPALGIDYALKEILEGKNKLYDEGVVNACLGVFSNHKFDFDSNPVDAIKEILL